MEHNERQELRDLIFKAWDTTPNCPDGSNGAQFCPSCFFKAFYNLLETRNNDVRITE